MSGPTKTTVPCVGIPYSIQYWWERPAHVWVIRIVDEHEEQVGDCRYAVMRDDLPPILKDITREAFEHYEHGTSQRIIR